MVRRLSRSVPIDTLNINRRRLRSLRYVQYVRQERQQHLNSTKKIKALNTHKIFRVKTLHAAKQEKKNKNKPKILTKKLVSRVDVRHLSKNHIQMFKPISILSHSLSKNNKNKRVSCTCQYRKKKKTLKNFFKQKNNFGKK